MRASKLSRHLWYLCEETVPLALFGSAPAGQKEALAKSIIKKAKTELASIGRPKLLKIRQITTTTSPPDLVG